LWTNYPFFFSLIILTILDLAILFTPGGEGTLPYSCFEIYSFVGPNGGNYSYRFFLFGLILANSLLTFSAEQLITTKMTKAYDKR
jgi:hypothetical protein